MGRRFSIRNTGLSLQADGYRAWGKMGTAID